MVRGHIDHKGFNKRLFTAIEIVGYHRLAFLFQPGAAFSNQFRHKNGVPVVTAVNQFPKFILQRFIAGDLFLTGKRDEILRQRIALGNHTCKQRHQIILMKKRLPSIDITRIQYAFEILFVNSGYLMRQSRHREIVPIDTTKTQHRDRNIAVLLLNNTFCVGLGLRVRPTGFYR